MKNRYLYITLMGLLGLTAEAQTPRLVVNIHIDQLRTDFLESYAPLYGADGFNRLLKDGMVFANGSYNFSPVDRASAIASVQAGTSPYYHGITGQEWLDRESLRPQQCISKAESAFTPDNLRTSTVGDELKVATDGAGKVYAFAPSADAAILSAGHAADGVLWINNNYWATATYYQPQDRWLSNYSRKNSPGADVNNGITTVALDCVKQTGMGTDDKPDLLNLTYEAGSSMQSYVNLDKSLAALIRGIEAQVSRDQVLFVLSGTAYREENDEDNATNARYRIPTGSFYIHRTVNLLNMYLGAIFGQAQYIEQCYRNHIFFNRQTLRQKNMDLGDVAKRSQEFLLQIAGIRNVYTANQLLTTDSPLLESVRNGFNVEKCGDLIIEVTPGWQLVNEETFEKSMSRLSCVPFPIILYGADVRKERIQTPVTADRIAPTIARAIRIRAPNACAAVPLF